MRPLWKKFMASHCSSNTMFSTCSLSKRVPLPSCWKLHDTTWCYWRRSNQWLSHTGCKWISLMDFLESWAFVALHSLDGSLWVLSLFIYCKDQCYKHNTFIIISQQFWVSWFFINSHMNFGPTTCITLLSIYHLHLNSST